MRQSVPSGARAFSHSLRRAPGVKLPFLRLSGQAQLALALRAGHHDEPPGLYVGTARCAGGRPDGRLDHAIGHRIGRELADRPAGRHPVGELARGLRRVRRRQPDVAKRHRRCRRISVIPQPPCDLVTESSIHRPRAAGLIPAVLSSSRCCGRPAAPGRGLPDEVIDDVGEPAPPRGGLALPRGAVPAAREGPASSPSPAPALHNQPASGARSSQHSLRQLGRGDQPPGVHVHPVPVQPVAGSPPVRDPQQLGRQDRPGSPLSTCAAASAARARIRRRAAPIPWRSPARRPLSPQASGSAATAGCPRIWCRCRRGCRPRVSVATSSS